MEFTRYDEDVNTVSSIDKNKYLIILTHDGTGNDTQCKTELESMLSHIIFDTPATEFQNRMIGKLSQQMPKRYHVRIRLVLSIIFDLFEDRRVQSNYSAIYPGTLSRFQQMRKDKASKLWSDPNTNPADTSNPITALQMAAFDFIPQDGIIQCGNMSSWMENVEHTGQGGGLIQTRRYWEQIVKPWFDKQCDEIQHVASHEDRDTVKKITSSASIDNMKDTGVQGMPLQRKQRIHKATPPSVAPTKSHNCGGLDPNCTLETSAFDHNKFESQSDQMESQLLQKICDTRNDYESDHDNFTPREKYDSAKIPKDAEVALEIEKRIGAKEIAELEKQLTQPKSHSQLMNLTYEHDFKPNIKKIEMPPSDKNYSIHQNSRQVLLRIFKLIHGLQSSEIDAIGNEIDVDSYIDYKVRGYGDFMVSEKNTPGFDIVIGIDESTSMSSESIRNMRNMAATLFHTFDRIPLINIKIVGWFGKDELCHVHEVTQISDVGAIASNGYTPLAAATWYCKHILEEMTSNKKIFFQITDGNPNDPDDIDTTRDAVIRMRQAGMMCYGIFLGDQQDDEMSVMFGSKFCVHQKTAGDVTSYLISQLAQKITQHVRNR